MPPTFCNRVPPPSQLTLAPTSRSLALVLPTPFAAYYEIEVRTGQLQIKYLDYFIAAEGCRRHLNFSNNAIRNLPASRCYLKLFH